MAGPVTATINNWVNPHVNSWNQVDVNLSRNFQMGGGGMTGYFVVQNILNAMPANIPNATIGQLYPVYSSGYSVQSPWAGTSPSASAPSFDAVSHGHAAMPRAGLINTQKASVGDGGFAIPRPSRP